MTDTTVSNSEQIYDVLIVGGGLVGASLAIALDQAGLTTAMIEATPGSALPSVFDERNLSFADVTVNALTALGVMQKLAAPSGQIKHIHISRKGDFGQLQLNAQDYGRKAFGQVVIARAFGEALEARMQELTHLTRFRPATFTGLDSLDSNHRSITIQQASTQTTLRARLLVAADGMHSQLRTALGIETNAFDYGQSLFVARARTDRPPDGTAYERFTDEGPTALLPRGDRHYGVVHGVAAANVEYVRSLTDAAYGERLQTLFGWRAGRFVHVGERSVYPIHRIVAQQLTAERAVVIGNAAQSLHPIGAQGFNLGLRDALTLAELIGQSPRDAGDNQLLSRYAQRRQKDRTQTLNISHGLALLTREKNILLRAARSAGFTVAANAPWLQSYIAGVGMGYKDDLPALCKGSAA